MVSVRFSLPLWNQVSSFNFGLSAVCELMFCSGFSAATEDLDNGSSSLCKESACEIRTSHDICESSSGSDPTEIDHSGEEQGATHHIGEPATTVSEDASERSVGSAVETSKQATCLHIIKKNGVLLSKDH